MQVPEKERVSRDLSGEQALEEGVAPANQEAYALALSDDAAGRYLPVTQT